MEVLRLEEESIDMLMKQMEQAIRNGVHYGILVTSKGITTTFMDLQEQAREG